MPLRRVPWELAAVALPPLAWLAAPHGTGLALRLAAATAALLVPGALVSRALRVGGAAAALAWTLALLTGAFALAFHLGRSLHFVLVLLAAAGAAALPAALLRRPREPAPPGRLAVLAAGAGLGIALWWVAGQVDGDALFHLGRVQKLAAFDRLSLHAVGEFRDGGLHPGYAFPLWHGFLALVAEAGHVDPALVVRHEGSALAPLAVLVAFEAGHVLFRSVWAGAAVAATQVALYALAPGHGGTWSTLALPSEAAWQILTPAALAAFFAATRSPRAGPLATLAAAGGALALVHPTYALFVAIPLAGFVVARALLAWRGVPAAAGSLAAFGAPALGAFAWLLPIVRHTASYHPSAADRQRSLARYAAELHAAGGGRYRLEAEVFTRRGAVAVAALCAIPLAALAARRRWAAFALGGSLALLGILLWPLAFTRLADAASLSQVRRAAGFLPGPFALAGGAAVLARPLGVLLPPLALLGGVALQLADPSDFGRLDPGGPGLVTWIAFAAAGGALVAATLVRSLPHVERPGLLAGVSVLALCLPVAVHGFRDWTPRDREGADPLTPGLVHALRTRVPERAVVWAEPETSYRIAAYAPVYVAVAPPTHVGDTKENRPYARYRDAARFRRTRSLAIPRRYGATWLVVDSRRSGRAFRLRLPVVYRDRRYALYRLPR